MPIRSRCIRRPSWAACWGRSGWTGCSAGSGVICSRLNSNYDAAIVTNPVLAERFAGFGLENIQVAPFGVERSKFSPDFAT